MPEDSREQLLNQLHNRGSGEFDLKLMPRLLREFPSTSDDGPIRVVRENHDLHKQRATDQSLKSKEGWVLYMNFGLGENAGLPQMLFERLVEISYDEMKNWRTTTVAISGEEAKRS